MAKSVTVKKRRIIINIEDGVDEDTAIRRVQHVMEEGRVSKGANDQDHYCWLTRWHDGVIVTVTPKYSTTSDIFTVYKEAN